MSTPDVMDLRGQLVVSNKRGLNFCCVLIDAAQSSPGPGFFRTGPGVLGLEATSQALLNRTLWHGFSDVCLRGYPVHANHGFRAQFFARDYLPAAAGPAFRT